MTEQELQQQYEAYTKRQKEQAIQEAAERKRKAQINYELLMPPVSDRTDAGQAERFIKYAAGKVAHNKQFGWSCYTTTADGGGVWISSDESVINLYLQFTVAQRTALAESGLMSNDATSKEAEAASSFIRRYRSASAVKAVMMIAASKAVVPPEAWDAEPYLLNVQNGVVDLRTGQLLPSKPEQYMRHICACKLSETPQGETMWQDTLDRIIIEEDGKPDRELQEYLQGIAGFAGLGKSYEVLYMCHSNGGSGKSTMWDTIAYTLGTYAVTVPPELLVNDEKRGDSGAARFMVDSLNGARLALMGETEDGQKLSTKQLKLLTANHKMSAEQKHKDRYEFTPTHTLVMHTNNIPRVKAVDDGTWDRLKIIPYRARIRGTEADDKQYRDKLKAGAAEAVLRWLIDGSIAVIAGGERLDEPQSVKTIVEKQRGECLIPESMSAFIEDCCSMDGADLFAKTKDFYDAYSHYASQNDFEVLGSTTFKRKLIDYYGISYTHDKNGSYYHGIELLH